MSHSIMYACMLSPGSNCCGDFEEHFVRWRKKVAYKAGLWKVETKTTEMIRVLKCMEHKFMISNNV